jgi:hypothetical protein
MGSINIDRLVEREKCLARNDGAIHGGVKVRDTRLTEARYKFRDVTDALRRGSGVPRPIAVPELKVCAVRFRKAMMSVRLIGQQYDIRPRTQ